MGWYALLLGLTRQEKDLIARSDLRAPALFVDDVRAKLREQGLLERFEREYARFVRAFGDQLCVGHVVVCSDRACRAAGVALIRDF